MKCRREVEKRTGKQKRMGSWEVELCQSQAARQNSKQHGQLNISRWIKSFEQVHTFTSNIIVWATTFRSGLPQPLSSRDDDPGVVYRLQCGDCEQAYIGETGRTACVASWSTRSASKMDDLTCLLLLGMPFLNSMLLILTMQCLARFIVTNAHSHSKKEL